MANFSDAYGTFKLNGTWERSQVEGIALVLLTQTVVGCMNFELKNSFEDFVEALSKGEEISFTGIGRWSFANNLMSFNRWTSDEDIHDEMYSTYNLPVTYKDYETYQSLKENVKNYMTANDLSINFDYVDEEAGNGYLAEVNVNINGDFKLITISGDTHTLNLKNHCEIFLKGDRSPLDEAVEEIVGLYLKRNSGINRYESIVVELSDFILSDSNWFNLEPFSFYEKKTDIDSPQIKKWLKENIK